MVLTRVECYFDTPKGTPGQINHLDLDLREHQSPSEVKKQIAILTDVPYKNIKLRLSMDYGLVAFDTRNKDIKVGTCGVSVSEPCASVSGARGARSGERGVRPAGRACV